MKSIATRAVWEKRWHPILNEWVIIASQTSTRPWSGAMVEKQEDKEPECDPKCFLCPGVKRASGEINPDYKDTFVFNNDFASFANTAPLAYNEKNFYKSEPAFGVCRVICFSPLHNVVLAQMPKRQIENIVYLWQKEFDSLSKNEQIKNILIFENKGKVIGVSNPHPHGQIYATGFIPKILLQEVDSGRKYFNDFNRCLFCDIVFAEIKESYRIVLENDSFLAFVPYFARYSYEVNIFSKRHFSTILEMTYSEMVDFADLLKRLLCKYDNLFGVIFPNIFMMHNAPVNGDDHTKYFHFHVEFYPPLRSQDKLKYLAGFESGGGNIINPTSPEFAANLIRNSSDVHFREKPNNE